ncbi:MAG: TIGR03032 family protein [Litoreibacter sp.]
MRESNDGEAFDLSEVQQPDEATRQITIKASPDLRQWMSKGRFSIAFNTYHIGKLFMVGFDALGNLLFSEASFPRSMGLSMHDRTLWMAGQKQIWRFENFLRQGQTAQGHDAVFMPMGATTTGMINLHDVRASDEGVYFISCNFNCIGKLHEKWSFEPVWKPPFISEFEFGDKCHLNCLALENGKPKYVTAFAETNEIRGWRNASKSDAAGIVIDVTQNEIICRGLHMPHSPQIHEGELYVANSGCGEFGHVDRKTGTYTPICFIPGFTRGVAFWRHFAFVGSSKPRHEGVFEGNEDTPLNKRLTREGIAPQCQISIIDLRSGVLKHTLTIEGVASEIYDVCIIPGAQRPFVTDIESKHMNTMFRPAHLQI